MIVAPEVLLSPVHVCRPRRSVDVAMQQLTAIDRFHASRRVAEEAATSIARTRQYRVDLSRRRDALRRQHQAVITKSHQHLCLTWGVLDVMAQRRVVLALHEEPAASAVVAAQVPYGDRVADQREAGGAVVFTHRVPPVEVARQLLSMLGRRLRRTT